MCERRHVGEDVQGREGAGEGVREGARVLRKALGEWTLGTTVRAWSGGQRGGRTTFAGVAFEADRLTAKFASSDVIT